MVEKSSSHSHVQHPNHFEDYCSLLASRLHFHMNLQFSIYRNVYGVTPSSSNYPKPDTSPTPHAVLIFFLGWVGPPFNGSDPWNILSNSCICHVVHWSWRQGGDVTTWQIKKKCHNEWGGWIRTTSKSAYVFSRAYPTLLFSVRTRVMFRSWLWWLPRMTRSPCWRWGLVTPARVWNEAHSLPPNPLRFLFQFLLTNSSVIPRIPIPIKKVLSCEYGTR